MWFIVTSLVLVLSAVGNCGCPGGFQEIGGSCFVMGSGKKTFKKATASCQQMGGFLVEPRSEEITDAVKTFKFTGRLWIGLTDFHKSTIFEWQTDRATLSYTNWARNQPDNYKGKQNCVALTKYGTWDDRYCGKKRRYICQAHKSTPPATTDIPTTSTTATTETSEPCKDSFETCTTYFHRQGLTKEAYCKQWWPARNCQRLCGKCTPKPTATTPATTDIPTTPTTTITATTPATTDIPTTPTTTITATPPATTDIPTTSTTATTDCGGTFSGDAEGTVTSPNHPGNYGHNRNCDYKIEIPTGRVKLTFESTNIEYNTPCNYDFVKVYDGSSVDATLLGTVCGTNNNPTFTASGNTMFLKFVSDNNIDGTGFIAYYATIESHVQCGVARPFHQIVGGHDTRIEEHPWQIYMHRCTRGSGCKICGGSIVSSTWIVSAAHCTAPAHAASDFTIYAGRTSRSAWSRGSKQFRVKRWIDHPDYGKYGKHSNDISLLELDGEIDFSSRKTRPICLATVEDSHTFDNQTCVVTGWGATSYKGPLSDVLQEVSVQVQTREECIRVDGSNGRRYSETHLCAGDVLGGVDACSGDSGGPLVCPRGDNTWVLAGVVSMGRGCASPDHYGFYSRVSNYASWIDETMAS